MVRIATAAATTTLLASAATLVSAGPFRLPNGFPNLSPSALQQVQLAAGGTLPNTPLPPSLSPAAVKTLQLIAANEIFEVAYFSTLLSNITNGVKGYTDVPDKDYVISALTQIVAQEQLHALGANGILNASGNPTVPSCNYKFPVSTFNESIALAQTFTDLVLGTLQGAQQTFATDGGAEASGLVPLVGSIIGQEGEQNGVYRYFQAKNPSSAPFLTASAGPFAFNALAGTFFIKPSCNATINLLGFPVWESLATWGGAAPSAKNSTLTFVTSSKNISSTGYSLVYISGQNFPVTVPIKVTSESKGLFTASFPFQSGFSKGLTLAALVKGSGNFTSAGAVANATIAGPGLIEID